MFDQEFCPICGKHRENCDRAKCLDPQVSVTWRASDWMEMMEAVGHYSKLLEAFDPGGDHRRYADKWRGMFKAVDDQLRDAVRAADRSGGV